jgi:hypothetical protein
MQGCASAHHWGRLAIAHGHEPKLLHAKYVSAYVRRNKTDAAIKQHLFCKFAHPFIGTIAPS